MANEHNEHGVRLLTNMGANALSGDGHVRSVILSNDEEIVADAVVVGIGVIPTVDLAVQAGLEVKNGIIVNEYGETSAPNVYAAGDVTNHYNPLYERRLRLESWQNAQDQAIAIARVMCGQREPYSAVPWFWSDQLGAKLQMAGTSDGFDRTVMRGSLKDGEFSVFYFDDDVLIGVDSINRPADHVVSRKLLAAGPNVSDQIIVDLEQNLKTLLE